MEIIRSKTIKLSLMMNEYSTVRNIQDPEKPKAPAKKAAKRKAGETSTGEEEKENQGVGNDTPPKTGRMVDPDKPKAPAKKAAKRKADKPEVPTKKAAKPKTGKPKTLTKNTTTPKTGVTQHDKPSKKCVKGYIHNVSKIMLSAKKNKYFTALFQKAKTCSKLLVFKEEHHQEYVAAEKNRIPVKLENIEYEHQRTGETDIKAGWDSKLSSLKKLPFSFDATKKQETNAEHKKIRDILKNPIINQRVHVAVKIMKIQKKGKEVTRANQTLPKTVYTVSDKSGDLDLTVWRKRKNLSVGKWYHLSNVSVREFCGKATLTTTPQTIIKEVAEAKAAGSFTDPGNKGVKEVQTYAGGEQAKKRKVASTNETTAGLAVNINVSGGSTVNVPLINETEARSMTLTANMNSSNK
ncbi:uncharacterized protein LOC103023016 [Astyanax mexicanus]|uniref:uncharacterized protein LOC103023016 n=1 Tax=Astyanax mexicanus TaxID=7994 RepID=UPI0020CAD906|nr:uncharacterized protein LOC103023016 [Astyanax mexicanus]